MQEEYLTGDIPVMPKEGSLLPETYKVARGMTRAQLLDRMAQDFDKLVKEVWARRAPDLPLNSPQELITLASVVEKETAKADERPRIAGVFINRLQRGMKLQSDPTIIYGLVGGVGTLGRPISRADIDLPTPYNTYVVPALPAGPICNPGRAALEAVANPSKTREMFFVADGTGGHVFAETYEQHQRNVARWRQIEAKQNEQASGNDMVTSPSPEKPADANAPAAQGKAEPQANQPAPPATVAPKPAKPQATAPAKPGGASTTKAQPPAKPAATAPKQAPKQPPKQTPKQPKKPLLPEEEAAAAAAAAEAEEQVPATE
jgi:UPF0755 protein